MRRRSKWVLLIGLIGWLVAAAPRSALAALADDGESAVGRAALMTLDVFPVRFGSFLRMVVGGVMLVPATAFSGLAYPFERNPGVFLDNYELYVGDALNYTFRRPLGEDLGL